MRDRQLASICVHFWTLELVSFFQQPGEHFPALEAHAFERSYPLDEKTMKSPYKMVFVVNTELGMGVGKIAAHHELKHNVSVSMHVQNQRKIK